VLEATGITKKFGGFVALDNVDLKIGAGERLALIGPNGSGKSTFVNCIAGTFSASSGSVRFLDEEISELASWQRARLGIARSFQIPRPFRGLTVQENVEIPLMFSRKREGLNDAGWDAQAALDSVGLGSKSRHSPTSLTQVELRKLELARALACSPRILIADEVMAGLSDAEIDEILELLVRLNASGIAVLMIEHIMRAVIKFSHRIAVLVAGKKIADGEPRLVMRHPEVVGAYLGK
jgi:branched-chain amino acid transport system ATP-binding protein